jgi:hypothetical protein
MEKADPAAFTSDELFPDEDIASLEFELSIVSLQR